MNRRCLLLFGFPEKIIKSLYTLYTRGLLNDIDIIGIGNDGNDGIGSQFGDKFRYYRTDYRKASIAYLFRLIREYEQKVVYLGVHTQTQQKVVKVVKVVYHLMSNRDILLLENPIGLNYQEFLAIKKIIKRTDQSDFKGLPRVLLIDRYLGKDLSKLIAVKEFTHRPSLITINLMETKSDSSKIEVVTDMFQNAIIVLRQIIDNDIMNVKINSAVTRSGPGFSYMSVLLTYHMTYAYTYTDNEMRQRHITFRINVGKGTQFASKSVVYQIRPSRAQQVSIDGTDEYAKLFNDVFRGIFERFVSLRECEENWILTEIAKRYSKK